MDTTQKRWLPLLGVGESDFHSERTPSTKDRLMLIKNNGGGMINQILYIKKGGFTEAGDGSALGWWLRYHLNNYNTRLSKQFKKGTCIDINDNKKIIV